MKTSITTEHAPAAIGPYSQAIRCAELVFCSGQIPLDPASGELVSSEIEAQTHQVMRNLQAVLNAAGSGLEHMLKTSIFLTDMADFNKVNEIYAEYIGNPAPARACIQVAALPRGAKIEIECTAIASGM